MIGSHRVLLVKSDTGAFHELSIILGFLDYDVRVLEPLSFPGDTLTDCLCVFLILDGQQESLLAWLDRELPPLPVVAIQDKLPLRSTAVPPEGGRVGRLLPWPTTLPVFKACLDYIVKLRPERGDTRTLELFRSLTGSSEVIQRTRQLIRQVADSDATVLILGESGTGKEVIARNLHHGSQRRGKAFVPVNCGAIPAELLESELFGHEKGAFTGALTARQGRFEMAEGGSLFLDEIGDMPLTMQVKLLRVLQERTFERVGSNKTLSCDVRIIAATHRNLEEQIAQNRFREDLFYRLNVFPIEVPALRHRVEDIPLLVGDLLARFKAENRGEISLSPRVLAALQRHQWPGNVRELANLMERLVILYPHQTIDLKDLPEKFQCYIDQDKFVTDIDLDDEKLALSALNAESDQPDQFSPRLPEEGLDLREHLNQLECELIRQALEDCNGVVAHAATRLRMRRTTLTEKLRKYGLRADEGQD